MASQPAYSSCDFKRVKMTGRPELRYCRFDVGSYLYLCHRDTLLKFPNSTLSKFVSPEFDKRKSEQDFIVIDRDGKHFGSILNYLRDGTIDLSNYKLEDIEQLRKEAEYYCLHELVDLCEAEPVRRKRAVREWSMINLEPPPPSIFYELEQAIEVIKERHDFAIVARARVLETSYRRDIYNLFYPIAVYFCLPNGPPENYRGSRSYPPSFILYNSEGEILVSSVSYSDVIDSYEKNDFLAKIKSTYINPYLKT